MPVPHNPGAGGVSPHCKDAAGMAGGTAGPGGARSAGAAAAGDGKNRAVCGGKDETGGIICRKTTNGGDAQSSGGAASSRAAAVLCGAQCAGYAGELAVQYNRYTYSYRKRRRISGQCRHQCGLSSHHRLSGHCSAHRRRQCARFNLNLGAGNREQAKKAVASAISMMATLGLIYMVAIQLFLPWLLRLFGATADVMPYATSYTRVTALGMPLLIVGKRHEQSGPGRWTAQVFHALHAAGCGDQHHSGPHLHLCLSLGRGGRRLGHSHRTGRVFCHGGGLYRAVPQYPSHFGGFQTRFFRVAANCSSGHEQQPEPAGHDLCADRSQQLPYLLRRTVVYGSEIPLATSGIVIKINAILVGIIVGISQGSQPIISFNYGAAQYTRVRNTYKLAVSISLAISAVGFVAFQVFPNRSSPCLVPVTSCILTFAVQFMRWYLFMVIVNLCTAAFFQFLRGYRKAHPGRAAFPDAPGVFSWYPCC